MTRPAVAVVLMLSALTCGAPTATPADACKGRLAGDLVITEAMIDPDGPDTGAEWFEVYNSLGTPLDLGGLTLYVKDVDGTNLKSTMLKAGTVPAMGYWVFGDVRGGPNPAWVNTSYADTLGSLGNSRGVIGVRCGTTVLDEVTYTRAAKSGRSRMLAGGPGTTPSALGNDAESSWCDAPVGTVYLTPNAGTPGQPNPPCQPEAMQGTCLDHGAARPIVPPQAGDLVITEVMARPGKANASTGEWFELLARADVDLNDVTLQNGAGSTDTLTSQDCLRVEAGQYALLARSADAFINGGLPAPTATYSLSLSGANERVILRRGDAGIDEAAIFASSSGKAWQLDPAKLDPVANDAPTNFCKASTRFDLADQSDFGSPGAVNPPCAELDAGLPDPDSCVDPVTLSLRAVRRPTVGDLVITEWLADPVAVDDPRGEYVEVLVKVDTDLNGLVLQDASTTSSTVQSTDCLAVTANSFVVFARNANPALNGHLPTVAATFAFDLNNGSDALHVTGADGGVLDSVSYTNFKAGVSTQLKPGLTDPADNDVPSNLCFTPDAGANRFGPLLPDGGAGGDLGTPGRENAPCP